MHKTQSDLVDQEAIRLINEFGANANNAIFALSITLGEKRLEIERVFWDCIRVHMQLPPHGATGISELEIDEPPY